jgi:cysteinyl-tRNA synthetase
MAMIVELIRRESAYEREGDVYFRVGSFPEYGRLSNQKLDQLAEQEPNPLKEDPRDFALWKSNKPGEDTSWDSPWGRGRPGWHIECSAMSEKYLGETFEIHGGGLDLVFPHHENEIAQSRSLGHGFAQTWMHNGMLRFRGEEMHKSLGNAISLREVLDRWGRETVLLFFMTGHWSKPLDFSDETMAQTAAQAETFRNYFVGLEYEPGEVERDALAQILEQDFNTPGALALFHDWRRRGQTTSLKWGLDLFGLGSLAASAIAPPDLVELAGRRHAARAAREFAEADRLREEISAAGWEVRDVAEGFELVPK